MATVKNLDKDSKNWVAGGTPITSMFNMETRNGEPKPVIQKALVELDGPAFTKFAEERNSWAIEDKYLSPGPIQYSGAGSNARTATLKLEKSV